MYKYDEEREEVIRPRKIQQKEKKPKADHKHEYEKIKEERKGLWLDERYQYRTYEKCTICGRIK